MAKESDKKATAANFPEWIIAALGMVLLFSALGFILYRAVMSESRPASLSVSVESIERSDQGFRVDFTVSNSGSQTAAAVMIEGELTEAGRTVEKSNASLGYAPGNSIRRGSIYFANDPNLHEIKVRAVGFEKP